MGIALLFAGMVLGTVLGRFLENCFWSSALETGEITVDGRTYLVRAVVLETGDAIDADGQAD